LNNARYTLCETDNDIMLRLLNCWDKAHPYDISYDPHSGIVFTVKQIPDTFKFKIYRQTYMKLARPTPKYGRNMVKTKDIF